MLNGYAKKAAYTALGALFVLGVGAIGNFVAGRASVQSVEKTDVKVEANTARPNGATVTTQIRKRLADGGFDETKMGGNRAYYYTVMKRLVAQGDMKKRVKKYRIAK